jgi:glycyl-tRNA synthetase
MSLALYDVGGLRFWTQNEIRLRNRIKETLSDCLMTALLDLNQMWRFEEVDTPIMMPRSAFSCAYGNDDVFALTDEIGGVPYALRAETTMGSYAVAAHLLKATRLRAPLCVYTMGQSFRQERTDGATAAKLRFNAFYQLEFQCIYSEGTTAPIAQTAREALAETVRKITGLDTRLIPSDRLPAYSRETIDIEVYWTSPTGVTEWKEVASTSIRTDFPDVASHKPYEVFEVAFGMDRLVCITNAEL